MFTQVAAADQAMHDRLLQWLVELKFVTIVTGSMRNVISDDLVSHLSRFDTPGLALQEPLTYHDWVAWLADHCTRTSKAADFSQTRAWVSLVSQVYQGCRASTPGLTTVCRATYLALPLAGYSPEHVVKSLVEEVRLLIVASSVIERFAEVGRPAAAPSRAACLEAMRRVVSGEAVCTPHTLVELITDYRYAAGLLLLLPRTVCIVPDGRRSLEDPLPVGLKPERG